MTTKVYMKKLIFIDNDGLNRAEEDSHTIQRRLDYAGLSNTYVNKLEIISDFRFLDEDKAYKLLFDPNNCIITYSMYTASHYNSFGQIIHFLNNAGSSELKDHVYIDGSGELPKALENFLKTMPNEYMALCKH